MYNGSGKNTCKKMEIYLCTLESGSNTSFRGERNANHQLGIGFFDHKRIGSAVKKVGFVSYCHSSFKFISVNSA